MSSLLSACGAFLLAVLWFDLMFDVQVLRHRGARVLPEEVLASIAAYYRRVTTEASPMNRAVAVVMLVAVGASLHQLFAGAHGVLFGLVALALCSFPIGLAAARVFAAARRLGTRADSPEVQSDLARAICRDHLVCIAGIGGFVALTVLSSWF